MLDKLGEKLLEQSPAGAIVIVVILIFMRYLKDRDRANRDYHREQRETLVKTFKQFHDEHIDARSESRDAVHRNTSALETNVSATNRNSFAVETLAKSIDTLARSSNVKH